MSHELRTPLNAILGYTELLQDSIYGEPPQKMMSVLERISRNGKHLLGLINDVLDLSKIEAGQLVLTLDDYSLKDVVHSVYGAVENLAATKNLAFKVEMPPSLPGGRGDERRLTQVLLNLVGNAIKFTDKGGVLVTIARSGASKRIVDRDAIEIVIAVLDTGMGIAPEALPSLFSEFEQAEDAVRRRQGGTGLGLAISRRLARAMGGDIVIASTPGGGSTFTTTIRLKATARSTSKARPAGVPAASQHVLLALDGTIERSALRLSLEGASIPLEESTIADAPGIIAGAAKVGEPFTRLIVDGRSGCQTAAQLLADARAVAPDGVHGVIVLDTAAKADFIHFRDAGFDAYLVRPVRPRSVLTHLSANHEPAEQLQVTAKSERQPKLLTMPSVLLVEDNDINALLARRMLEKVGCRVRHCVNGREAVDAFVRVLSGVDKPYDLVLMDAHMPVLDGLEATRAIKGLYATREDSAKCAPIVAVTANAFDEDRRRCLEAGMDDYLAKPFDRDELNRLLVRWCHDLILAAGNARVA
jgi:CheY-like chemotaxis protein